MAPANGCRLRRITAVSFPDAASIPPRNEMGRQTTAAESMPHPRASNRPLLQKNRSIPDSGTANRKTASRRSLGISFLNVGQAATASYQRAARASAFFFLRRRPQAVSTLLPITEPNNGRAAGKGVVDTLNVPLPDTTLPDAKSSEYVPVKVNGDVIWATAASIAACCCAIVQLVQ